MVRSFSLLAAFTAAVMQILIFSGDAYGQDAGTDNGYVHLKDISYVSDDETDAYRLDRCRLDIYYPADTEGCAPLI